jgi:hypothetical protein
MGLEADWSALPEAQLGLGHATELFAIDGAWWMSRFSSYVAPAPGGKRSEAAIWFDPISWSPDPLAPPRVERDPWDGQWSSDPATAFPTGPAFGENAQTRGEAELGIQGNFFLSTNERYRGPLAQGQPGEVDPVGQTIGTIRSKVFRLRHRTLLLLVGGDSDPQGLWVRLRDAEDLTVLAWTTGPGHPQLEEVVWDVGVWRDREVVLELVDANPRASLSLDYIRGTQESRRARTFSGQFANSANHP